MTEPARRSKHPAHRDATILTLREERLRRRLSQRDLAEFVGISRVTLTTAETGKRATYYHNVVAWANALGFELQLVQRKRETP